MKAHCPDFTIPLHTATFFINHICNFHSISWDKNKSGISEEPLKLAEEEEALEILDCWQITVKRHADSYFSLKSEPFPSWSCQILTLGSSRALHNRVVHHLQQLFLRTSKQFKFSCSYTIPEPNMSSRQEEVICFLPRKRKKKI